jgi:hypothetical protein
MIHNEGDITWLHNDYGYHRMIALPDEAVTTLHIYHPDYDSTIVFNEEGEKQTGVIKYYSKMGVI